MLGFHAIREKPPKMGVKPVLELFNHGNQLCGFSNIVNIYAGKG